MLIWVMSKCFASSLSDDMCRIFFLNLLETTPRTISVTARTHQDSCTMYTFWTRFLSWRSSMAYILEIQDQEGLLGAPQANSTKQYGVLGRRSKSLAMSSGV